MDDSAATSGQVFANSFVADDRASAREIGPFDVTHQVEHAHLRLVEQGDAGAQNFAQVVRRHACREAQPDAILPVDRRRNARRQVVGLDDSGVLLVRRYQRHCVFADVAQHDFPNARQAHFRIAHRRRWIVVVAAEVALAVDQRVAQ